MSMTNLDRVLRKVSWNILPFLIVCFFFSILDRVNVSFAALSMNNDIGLNSAAYGVGAGVFFISYILFEVPSNLALQRFGARKWIGRIMISWGFVATCMAFIQGPIGLFTMRLLLGAMEAGFYPGVMLYLTYWYPSASRGRTVAVFLLGNPVATVIGAPLSIWMLQAMDGLGGIGGWRWLFVMEGLPAVFLGLWAYWRMTDQPSDAAWLSADERRILTEALTGDDTGERRRTHSSIGAALRDKQVLTLATINFCLILVTYSVGFWLPLVVKAHGVASAHIGWVVPIPYLVSIPVMLAWARHSDRTRERRFHLILPLVASGFGFLVAGTGVWVDALAMQALGIVIAAVGFWATYPVFWTLPSSLLAGTSAAAGIAWINSLGHLGGFAGPVLIGAIKDATNGYAAAFVILSIVPLLAATLVARLSRRNSDSAGIELGGRSLSTRKVSEAS